MPPRRLDQFQGCCAHDHDCEQEECGGLWTLYTYIDPSRTSCLNERDRGSSQNVFRAWDDRLRRIDNPLRSDDDDPELLLHIEFTGQVKLKAISVIGLGPDGSAPSSLRMFINRNDLDFSVVHDATPVQEWDLLENFAGDVEYPVKTAKCTGVHSIDLHFPSTFGGEEYPSWISFIGFKGEFEERRREAVNAVYESRPVPKDHKVFGDEKQGFDTIA